MNRYNQVACWAFMATLPVATMADSTSSEPAFVAGRPGNAEGPIAVPEGFFQVETGIASYTYDKTDGIRTESWSLAQTSLRYGVDTGTDAQLIVTPYSWQHQTGTSNIKGFGNTTLRLLHTFSGLDGSSPGFALIGFVTLPTASQELKDGGLFSDRTEGGLIATGSMAITDKATATLTLGGAARHPANAYVNDISAAANLTYAITDSLAVYAELFTDKVAFQNRQDTVDFGVTYLLDRVTQLDAGVNIGANEDTPDTNVFVGWSHRF